MKSVHRLWWPPIACIALGLVGGWVAGPVLGLGVMAGGFGLISLLRTRSLIRAGRMANSELAYHEADETIRALADRIHADRLRIEQLQRELVALREAWDLLPESVVVIDVAHRIVWANTPAKKHLAIDRDAHIGEPLSRHWQDSALVRALQDGFIHPIEVQSAQSPHRVLCVAGMKIGDTGWLLAASDVTDAKRIEAVRRDFVANVAHELKTPLTVISGFNETLRDVHDLSRDELNELTQLMHAQTVSMQRLIADLLSLSRLESQNEEAPRTPFALASCLERARACALLAWPDGAPIQLGIKPGVLVFGEENEIESAILNLLTNALRHTGPDGLITVSLRKVEGDNTVALDVADSGIGIAPEHIPRLTERFYRVDRGRSRQSGGTGLGLAIVKHVMIRHEGHLQIKSEVGKGSTFSLVFPAHRIAGV